MTNDTQKARRAYPKVTIGGHDATDWISPTLLTFSYTDNISGKADEVQLTLQDRDKKWIRDWQPEKGMDVTALIECTDWFAEGENVTLFCGAFKVDEVSLQGPPDVFSLKATTSELTSSLRDSTKTKAWEKQELQALAQEIAGKHGLTLHYEGPAHNMQRVDQREEADLSFLHRLAKERGMECKVYDKKIVLFDSQERESQGASFTLSRTKSVVTQYSFKGASSKTSYTGAEVRYTDSNTGTVHSARAQREQGQGQKAIQLNARVESSAEAMRLAEKTLHNANKGEQKASLTCMGHPELVAGINVELEDFGNFSGVYIIEKATHSLGSSGYTTALELRKCNTSRANTSSEGSKPLAQK